MSFWCRHQWIVGKPLIDDEGLFYGWLIKCGKCRKEDVAHDKDHLYPPIWQEKKP
jgi:hypothetical protein